MIRLIALRKTYGGKDALKGLELHISPGEVFGFLGPNGAGKTTTMRLIAGLVRPTSGRILIEGIDTAEDPINAKARLGYIPDRPYLYDRLTGLETMQFIGEMYGLLAREVVKRAEELLTRFGIFHAKDQLAETYSHGMKQRLALAAALLHEPRALLIDEPMVGLDPKGAKLVKTVLREEAARGSGVFLSTHSLAVAEEVCDRIGILQHGRLIALGTVAELKSQAGVDTGLEEIFLKLTEEAAEDAVLSP